MKRIILRNGTVINEGEARQADILIEGERIAKIGPIGHLGAGVAVEELDVEGCYVLPGLIDDQVHFREPGLTHKAEISTESAAAAAGGITSYMEMPNTNPAATTQELLEQKYRRAAEVSAVNYSFYMGAANDNLEQVLRTSKTDVCGVKAFLGSSTGHMLVDDPTTLEQLFSRCDHIIAVHSETESIIRENLAYFKARFGDDIPVEFHPEIRSRQNCFQMTEFAVGLAKKHGTRLHVLHISTAEEVKLFEAAELKDKKITAEACVHHLHFTSADYENLGSLIKCNPAIKTHADQEAVWQGIFDGRIDIIATDHAPHTWEEKQQPYTTNPSGLPLVQHSLQLMYQAVMFGQLPLAEMVRLMCHAPADLFRIEERGYLREGWFADIAILDPNTPQEVSKDNILYKCGWSPFEGQQFLSSVRHTFCNGKLVWSEGKMRERAGQRLRFNRP